MPRKETWQRHDKTQLQQLGVFNATGAYKAPLQKTMQPSQQHNHQYSGNSILRSGLPRKQTWHSHDKTQRQLQHKKHP